MYRTIIIVLIAWLVLPVKATSQGDDLGLEQAIGKALENNYGIRIAEKAVDIAGVSNNWAAAGRMPTVSFDASSLNNQDFVDGEFSSRLNAGLGLRWTIFDGFRVNITRERLDELERLSEGRAAVVVETTIEDVILAYYLVLLNRERLGVLEKVMNLSFDRYQYMLNLKELGNSVTYDVLQAKNNWLTDKSAWMSQEVSVRNSIRNLNFIIGEDPSAGWNFTEPLSAELYDYNLGDMLGRMLNDNNNITNQYINISLGKSDEQLSRATFYPSVSLSAGVDNNNTFTGVAPGSGFAGYSNITLSYNIYQGGSRKRATEIARLNRETREIEIEQLRHSLTNQLFNMFDLYNVRKELYTLAIENLEAAELNLGIAEEKLRAGAINSFNYRDIQLIYLNVALQQIQSVYNLIVSDTELTRITGGFVKERE